MLLLKKIKKYSNMTLLLFFASLILHAQSLKPKQKMLYAQFDIYSF